MMEQFNVRIILDGLDELEDRSVTARVILIASHQFCSQLFTADSALEHCCSS
jgi:hypothetical protein